MKEHIKRLGFQGIINALSIPCILALFGWIWSTNESLIELQQQTKQDQIQWATIRDLDAQIEDAMVETRAIMLYLQLGKQDSKVDLEKLQVKIDKLEDMAEESQREPESIEPPQETEPENNKAYRKPVRQFIQEQMQQQMPFLREKK